MIFLKCATIQDLLVLKASYTSEGKEQLPIYIGNKLDIYDSEKKEPEKDSDYETVLKKTLREKGIM